MAEYLVAFITFVEAHPVFFFGMWAGALATYLTRWIVKHLGAEHG